MFEMKDEYLVGVDLIDNEHRTLFEIANKTYMLLKEEFIPDKYDNIISLIRELQEYTAKHFADEEAYMESIQYKLIFSQKTEHEAFLGKLNEVELTDLDEGQEDIIMDLLEFLTEWLVHHIMEKDKLIGEV